MTIHYYYAVMSGFAYLGEQELRRIAAAAGRPVIYKPMDILKVFAATDTTAPAKQSPARRAYRDLELTRWAAIRGLPLNTVPKFWPVPPAEPSKAVLAAQDLGLDPGRLSFALLRGVWVEDKNIADTATLVALVRESYPDQADAVLARAASPEAQGMLDSVTQEAISAGVFGSPTIIVNGEMFFGQDRLDMVAKKLGVAA